MATVLIPAPLRRLTAGQARIVVPAGSVAELLDRLDARYPGMRAYLLDDAGTLRAYVNIFVNSAEVRSLAGLQTPLADGDEVAILPAMAGGA
ncbi:MAG: MoaD family protein [Armatimonadota bacterium]|nr:MoaD family protein [Armatimonadota bacterium]MDR7532492.1 MoaD family protein [Armatimonadota bacterium]MDR7535617.1 MoaD family protein [Armatimonadota bacterium]